MLPKAFCADGREILLMHRGDHVTLDTNREDIHLETTESPRRRLVPEVHLT